MLHLKLWGLPGTADTNGHFFFHSPENLVLYMKLPVNLVFFFLEAGSSDSSSVSLSRSCRLSSPRSLDSIIFAPTSQEKFAPGLRHVDYVAYAMFVYIYTKERLLTGYISLAEPAARARSASASPRIREFVCLIRETVRLVANP